VKIGAENKKQVQWMIALLALALLVGIYNFVGFGSSSAASSPATSSTGTQSNAQSKKPGAMQSSDSTLDPRFRWDFLVASQNKKYEPGRNIFRMEEAPVPTAVASVRQRQPIGPEPPPTPTPTPPPPPIPLKFYGFASKPSEPKKVFLDDEGEVFVAKQGEIVERRYKVIQINNTSVVIEDALNNNRQTIQITAK
jgi:hypothetical protein